MMAKVPRRVVMQITGCGLRYVALCSDGSLWELEFIEMSQRWKWSRLPDVPDVPPRGGHAPGS